MDDDVNDIPTEPLILDDGGIWIADPDLLEENSGATGVIAVSWIGGALLYLDGETRQWVRADSQKKPERTVRPLKPV